MLENYFRQLREAWFQAYLYEYPPEEGRISIEADETRMIRNRALEALYDEQTEKMIRGESGMFNAAPMRIEDMEE